MKPDCAVFMIFIYFYTCLFFVHFWQHRCLLIKWIRKLLPPFGRNWRQRIAFNGVSDVARTGYLTILVQFTTVTALVYYSEAI